MKKVLLILLMIFMMVVSANADTMQLGGAGSTPVYNGAYVGPIMGSKLNGVTLTDGAMCIDAASTSYFGSSWSVNVSTIDPLNLTNSRFGNAGLFQYQEVAWLMGQIPTNQSQVGPIQFAAWRIFEPTYMNNKYGAPTADEAKWLLDAASINPKNFNWSSVQIFTPTEDYARNQEFITGNPTTVPVPGTLLLLGSGVLFLIVTGKRECNA